MCPWWRVERRHGARAAREDRRRRGEQPAGPSGHREDAGRPGRPVRTRLRGQLGRCDPGRRRDPWVQLRREPSCGRPRSTTRRSRSWSSPRPRACRPRSRPTASPSGVWLTWAAPCDPVDSRSLDPRQPNPRHPDPRHPDPRQPVRSAALSRAADLGIPYQTDAIGAARRVGARCRSEARPCTV